MGEHRQFEQAFEKNLIETLCIHTEFLVPGKTRAGASTPTEPALYTVLSTVLVAFTAVYKTRTELARPAFSATSHWMDGSYH